MSVAIVKCRCMRPSEVRGSMRSSGIREPMRLSRVARARDTCHNTPLPAHTRQECGVSVVFALLHSKPRRKLRFSISPAERCLLVRYRVVPGSRRAPQTSAKQQTRTPSTQDIQLFVGQFQSKKSNLRNCCASAYIVGQTHAGQGRQTARNNNNPAFSRSSLPRPISIRNAALNSRAGPQQTPSSLT